MGNINPCHQYAAKIWRGGGTTQWIDKFEFKILTIFTEVPAFNNCMFLHDSVHFTMAMQKTTHIGCVNYRHKTKFIPSGLMANATTLYRRRLEVWYNSCWAMDHKIIDKIYGLKILVSRRCIAWIDTTGKWIHTHYMKYGNGFVVLRFSIALGSEEHVETATLDWCDTLIIMKHGLKIMESWNMLAHKNVHKLFQSSR